MRLAIPCRMTLLSRAGPSSAPPFDVIHAHPDLIPFPIRRGPSPCPSVTTLHGRLDLPGLPPLYREFCDLPLDLDLRPAQRPPLPRR